MDKDDMMTQTLTLVVVNVYNVSAVEEYSVPETLLKPLHHRFCHGTISSTVMAGH